MNWPTMLLFALFMAAFLNFWIFELSGRDVYARWLLRASAVLFIAFDLVLSFTRQK